VIVNIVRGCRSLLSFEEIASRYEVEVRSNYLILRMPGTTVIVYRSGTAIVVKTGEPPEWITDCTVQNVVGVIRLPPMTEEQLLEIAERFGIRVDRTERSPGYTIITPQKKIMRVVLGHSTSIIYFAKSIEEAGKLEEWIKSVFTPHLHSS
jgi:hypothetical protein